LNIYQKQHLIEKINSLEEIYQVTGGADLLTLYEQFSFILLAHITMNYTSDTPGLPSTLARLCKKYIPSERIMPTDGIYHIYQEKIWQIGELMKELHSQANIQIANLDVFTLILETIGMVIPSSGSSYPDEDLTFLLEYMLNDCLSKSRDNYFGTSSSLAKFILETADRNEPKNVYDPACGTGAFLIAAGQRYGQLCSVVGNEQNLQLKKIAQINILFFGIQADVQSLNDIETANWEQKFDFVVSNPPFSTLSMGYIDSQHFDLDVETKHRYRAFIQILLKKIRHGGSGAIIVPNSFLLSSNRDAILIRKWLLENYLVEGIIALPTNTFYPKANVNASAIIVTAIYGSIINSDTMVTMLESPQAPRNRAAEASDFNILLKLWRDKNAIQSEWFSQMQNGGTINLHGIAAPTGWSHDNIWFADMKDIQRLDYCLLPKQYQPVGTFQMSMEEPQNIIRDIMETEKQILTTLESMEQELQRNV
jgi:type I restriction enzyme M protein